MKKQKYADTIRKKAEMKTDEREDTPREKFTLNPFNRLFFSAMLAPLFTLLYYPINRYIAVPKLGTGAPYVDMNGALIETYFSANTLARLLFYIMLALSELLLFKNTKALSTGRRVGALLLGTLLNVIGGFIFLEFSLWSN